MKPVPAKWSVADSVDTYAVRTWGQPYFGVNDAGNVVVHPRGEGSASADLKDLVDEVRKRGIEPPLLIRFTDILRHRVEELNESFLRAIREAEYQGGYRGVYPIKVNQVSSVVSEVLEAGRPFHFGLEAGSKPELLAVIALLDDPEALIVCNGYKDEEYVTTALLASRLGRHVIMVVEKLSELRLIADVAERVKIRPTLGIRVRLSSRGSGKWEASGGDRSKFGLSSSELVDAMAFLRERGMLDCFELLHFHLGSQISAIRKFKDALREAGRFYCELSRAGATLRYLDVGGGLGVDYDGSQSSFASSMNYSLQEYANDIVYGMKELCDAANVAHPTIVSESGRATAAHHAVLVIEVLGAIEFRERVSEQPGPKVAPVVHRLYEAYRDLSRKNMLESYHDAQDFKEQCLQMFILGNLSLDERVAAENLYWALCHKVLRLAKELDEMPEDLEHLERDLSDTYFCNFSVFQSLPDSWAIDHLFPIMPVHRLAEEPTRRAVLADITCDSDGKLDRFIGKRDVKDVLELHPLKDDSYYLGIFLAGAYQEILGDLHNLFGDTNDVQVRVPEGGGYLIDNVLPGDTVTEVLNYVSYSRDDLMARLRRSVEQALRTGQISLDDSRALMRAYEQGLNGYTYLERE
ncbi:MAG: biosynthetic arginine decarboxylase [Polyangiaceae bacterium]|nr:biosynthetic arginine decarboxylase [Polyangiaceae bacterium]